ncbi:hypothetical protein FE391_02540 [Nonomuraea sp. KC401]|uniref:hypothetical protein n=1 Tax=unclassified Nonomuraea TaxID=2593643 RepID=UPI0010FF0F3E|nr:MULTISPECIES: hypothetical protein [unclassified Nonomuraea]NBE92102.1 hypothetical protein [Nonomuraea sp. K271]TLF85099.1 hypothetical protein FE391_02540 [Nonomuraea sp. KC401]
MDHTTIDYGDYAEYDRRQRDIEHHLLAAFLGGLAVGFMGMFVAGDGPGWLGRLYEPYVYLALSLAVGATASGFGWALVTTFLAAMSTLVSAVGASALRGDDVLGVAGDAAGVNRTLALLVCLGLAAYVTRRNDVWGDLAAAALGAALIADVAGRAVPGLVESDHSFWPYPAVVIGLLSVALVLGLRRNAWGRMRALALAAMLSGLLSAGLAGAPAGVLPLPV